MVAAANPQSLTLNVSGHQVQVSATGRPDAPWHIRVDGFIFDYAKSLALVPAAIRQSFARLNRDALLGVRLGEGAIDLSPLRDYTPPPNRGKYSRRINPGTPVEAASRRLLPDTDDAAWKRQQTRRQVETILAPLTTLALPPGRINTPLHSVGRGGGGDLNIIHLPARLLPMWAYDMGGVEMVRGGDLRPGDTIYFAEGYSPRILTKQINSSRWKCIIEVVSFGGVYRRKDDAFVSPHKYYVVERAKS